MQRSAAPSDAEWDWLHAFRPRAFETLMPVPASDGLIAYRSYRDLYQDVFERYFSIRSMDATSKGRFTAAVVMPVGRSIQQQMLDLHMKDRTAPFEAIVSKIAIRRLSLESSKCEAVSSQMARLSVVSIGVHHEDVIHLHPVVHRFAMEWSGGQIDAEIVDQDHPLVRWSAQTLDRLLACGTK